MRGVWNVLLDRRPFWLLLSRTSVVTMACVFASASIACSAATTRNPGSGGNSNGAEGSSPGSGGAHANGSSGSASGGASPSGSGSSSSGSGGASPSGSGGASPSGSGGASPSGLGGAGPSGSAGSTPSGVAVKLDAMRQTIQGFGVSTMFMPASKSLPVDKVFGTTGAEAIGLSILRVGMNADGSLTLYIQKDSPGKDKEANWLPAPNDTIYLVMRLYWPKTEAPSILPAGEGTWKPPGIVKAS